MNWSNVRILQWLIKELITRHPSDAAELNFRITEKRKETTVYISGTRKETTF